ncbi:MAG TPA: phosphoenolpyruvate carboxylase [Longimicrobiaceae bacterium]|nr:phosphoenolpyruvate carboxylase [Longimicrobiaceae bacterium]
MSRWRGLRVEAEGTGISRELSEKINLLGEMLGQVIREEAGERLFGLVEELRLACKSAAAEGRPGMRDEAARVIGGLDLSDIVWLLRSFTAFFHLSNQAEQHEIVRINRERSGRPGETRVRPESIDQAIGQLREQGVPLARVLEILGRLEIEPTLTAHPTEARRRSILEKQGQISALLTSLAGQPTPGEESEALERLYAQISVLLATDEVRAERPTVEDEVEQGLYFLQGTIWEVLPRIHRDLLQAIRKHYGESVTLEPVVRYRSWIGSDRDGNPSVTPEVTRKTLRSQRGVALRKQLAELTELGRELSISDRRAEIPPELHASLERDALEVVGMEELEPQQRHEPYRLKIVYMATRLREMLAALDGEGEGAGDYGIEGYRADLDLIDRCLRRTGFADVAEHGRLARVRVLAKSFGFRLAALDVRQHSRVHEEAVAELLRAAGVTDGYAGASEAERLEILERELASPRPLLPRGFDLPDAVREVLDTFALIREALAVEPQSIGCYIVSMTHAVSDLLEPLLLAKEVGLWSAQGGAPLDFVPLFETIEDLEAAGERTSAMLRNPVYARQVEARGDFQEIMLGYSDSNKDGGYWMANWALHKAQEQIGRACREAGVEFRLFHGRGGTVGRGGGRASHAILAMPPEVRNGRIRLTEQGEVISFRYALTDIARRHLEQVVHAMIVAESHGGPSGAGDAGDDGLMEEIAQRSMRAYRDLIDAPGLWDWYTRVTPIEQISRLPIASRPISRGSTSEVDFEGLRAIPWVFAWTQVRYLVPGWFGVGTALHGILTERDDAEPRLRRLYREWPFFRAVVDNASRELARARLEIAERYGALNDQPAAQDFHTRITGEFELARDAILRVSQQRALLDESPVIRKSIALRNPYTDVLNLLQIELLRRYREAKDDDERQRLRPALFLSVNGIAAAMQSTG